MENIYIADAASWWASQSGAQHFFFSIGVISGILALALTALAVIGLDHDFGAIGHDGGASEAFSIRALIGFFLGFGWVGYATLECGGAGWIATLAAIGAGAFMMLAIRTLLRGMKHMKSDGTVVYGNAVGASGIVYVSIPADRASGGQVTVIFDNRSETLPAIQTGLDPIPGGTRIRVTETHGRTLTVVKA